jgi:hypothetical protein
MSNGNNDRLNAALDAACAAIDARFGKGTAKGDPELPVDLAAAMLRAEAQRDAGTAVAAAILHVVGRGGFGGWAPALWRMSEFDDAVESVRRQLAENNGGER